MEYKIRNMKKKELNIAIEWARNEGWNPGIHDAECFWEVDKTGFFIGILGNKPIACISLVKYGTDYAFGGFYIVKKGYRDKGFGIQLTKVALDYAKGRNIGGDAVIENLEMYSKLGLTLDHYNARYEFRAKNIEIINKNVAKLNTENLEELIRYDEEVFGYNREKFLRLWLTRNDTNSFVYKEKGEVKGYGVIRKCFSGYKIGPLFADGDKIAITLFKILVNSIKVGEIIYWDVSEICGIVSELVEKYNMKKVFATGRIYSKGRPKLNLKKWYGITSFELG